MVANREPRFDAFRTKPLRGHATLLVEQPETLYVLVRADWDALHELYRPGGVTLRVGRQEPDSSGLLHLAHASPETPEKLQVGNVLRPGLAEYANGLPVCALPPRGRWRRRETIDMTFFHRNRLSPWSACRYYARQTAGVNLDRDVEFTKVVARARTVGEHMNSGEPIHFS